MCHTRVVNHLNRHPDARAAGRWQPPGCRWGFGSGSVVQYLSQSVQTRLEAAREPPREDGPIRNPVFEDMGILVPYRT